MSLLYSYSEFPANTNVTIPVPPNSQMRRFSGMKDHSFILYQNDVQRRVHARAFHEKYTSPNFMPFDIEPDLGHGYTLPISETVRHARQDNHATLYSTSTQSMTQGPIRVEYREPRSMVDVRPIVAIQSPKPCHGYRKIDVREIENNVVDAWTGISSAAQDPSLKNALGKNESPMLPYASRADIPPCTPPPQATQAWSPQDLFDTALFDPFGVYTAQDGYQYEKSLGEKGYENLLASQAGFVAILVAHKPHTNDQFPVHLAPFSFVSAIPGFPCSLFVNQPTSKILLPYRTTFSPPPSYDTLAPSNRPQGNVEGGETETQCCSDMHMNREGGYDGDDEEENEEDIEDIEASPSCFRTLVNLENTSIQYTVRGLHGLHPGHADPSELTATSGSEC